MRREYLVSHIYFDMTIVQLSLLRDTYKVLDVKTEDTLLLERFRCCCDNFERAQFLSRMINEELEVLVTLVNDTEFNCICCIIKRLKVDNVNVGSASMRMIEDALNKKKKSKIVEYYKELFVDGVMSKVKFIKEVVYYE